ncbi:unnamed protein product [Coffea canephora]|uniref:Transcription repressor n=1 Tax=Coffea canephora TaxID=49390 RepID=A0A068TS32_COFCA|nr:unnamed protein product [Coffea canephora]
MANIFRKNFYLCVSKIKCLPTTLSPPLTLEEEEEEEEEDYHDNAVPINIPNAGTSSSLKNFNSLYRELSSSDAHSNSKSLTSSTDDFFSSSEDSDDNSDSIPDFSTIFASQRFFFSSPGNSNSIIESPVRPQVPEPDNTVVSGGVAIHTYSPDPYTDFRRSMQEMVDAKELKDVKADWDFLHELLLCYLNLNPKHTHKFIIGAFTDLIVSLMSSTTAGHSGQKTDDHHRKCKEPVLVL